MRNPRAFFRPLSVGAPSPQTEVPARPYRMIHFFPPQIEKVRAKIPDLIPQVDVLLGNLEDAIPASDKEAARDGLIEVFGGMGLMLGGSVWAAADAISQQDQQHRTVPIIPLALALAGCAIMIYGGADLAGAEPYRWDAINLFNDGAVETPRLGPPGSVAKASLHMRD